jgi:hypothetical protein
VFNTINTARRFSFHDDMNVQRINTMFNRDKLKDQHFSFEHSVAQLLVAFDTTKGH